MKKSNKSNDILIIGSGPIGAIYARILVESGRNVTMLDAGPQLSAVPGQHIRNARVNQYNKNQVADIISGNLHPLSVPSKTGYQDTLDKISYWSKNNKARNFHNPKQDPSKNLVGAESTYAVGGMFTHWTAATPRQHPKLERTDIISGAEWDVLYSEAEKYFNTHTDQFDFVRNKLVKKTLTQHFVSLPAAYPYPVHNDYPVQNLPIAAKRRSGFGKDDEYVHWTGMDTILGPVLTDPELSQRLTILPEHLVKRLITNSGKVTHVVVEDFNTLTTFEMSADLFIVATGAILSPQLLWASDIRPNALGRYLNDQIVASCITVLSKDLVESLGPPLSKDDPIPMPNNAQEPEVWIPVSDHRPWHCQIHDDPINFTTPGGEYVDERLLVFLQWFGMVEAEEHNRVFFDGDYKDMMGMPQPTFEYTPSTAAIKRAHDMIGDLSLASLSIGGWLPGQLPQFEPSGSSLHFMSTTRMGKADDGKSVVDPYSKVWGFDNLYVGGCGVIPEKSACNPTLTAAAIAIRSAWSITGN